MQDAPRLGHPRRCSVQPAAVGLALVAATATVALVALVALVGPGSRSAGPGAGGSGEGAVPRPAWESRPAVEATFLRDSYRPGATATLVLWSAEPRVVVQVFRAGDHRLRAGAGSTTMRGRPVTRPLRLGATAAHHPIPLRVGQWRSGLYFARLQAAGRVGFAPFVVRPRVLGASDVLVVQPTFTWQAYNHRDDDRDGLGDTWYASPRHATVRLDRPYLSRGVPPHFTAYDLPFLNWLSRTRKTVDMISDGDLDALPRTGVLSRYRIVVFPGHHEYVTHREYDAIERYRDAGGRLMFLSANNLYWHVERRGNVIRRTAQWRDLGRPEASLVGVQFLHNDNGERRGAWVVRTSKAPWLFEGTGLRLGDRFGSGGIEIDHTTSRSPRGTIVLAEIPDVLAPGLTAQMTYYETPRGARVFAAGAFTLGGARNPVSLHLVQHVWDRMLGSSPRARPSGGYPSRAAARDLASLRRGGGAGRA